MRDEYDARVTTALSEALAASRDAPDPETAVVCFTAATRRVLGDPARLARPDALKPGETQFVVSGCFFVAPSGDHMILCAQNGFPPSQSHARVSTTDSRPGHTVQTGIPAVVPNTDVDPIFRQILASGVVGCSVYVPVFWEGRVIGMFNTAAQARYFFDERDLATQVIFAAAAAATWMAKGGPAYLASLAASLPPWTAP
ncbi:GAF domain-containing protein [uncultured Enterovirga sp.]|uniref:GAF domain-containing protein n=1 Tax=uncultured Enterovirga sp. TaxID=2026352 RepID=UPI0035CA2F9B